MKRCDNFKRKNPALIQFTVSFLICAFIFSAAALAVVLISDPGRQNTQAAAAVSGTGRAFPELSPFTMLITAGAPDGSLAEAMLFRLDTKEGRTVIMPVPAELTGSGATGGSVADVYREGGVSSLKSTVHKMFSINIDYTCDISSENFCKIFELLGGLYGSIPEDITCQVPGYGTVCLTPSSSQYLSGQKIYALCAFNGYSGGASIKYGQQISLMKEFIQEKLSDNYLTRPADNFGGVFNCVSTNFTMYSLIRYTDAMKALSQERDIKAVCPAAITDGGLCTLSNTKEIKDFFS